MPRDRDMISIDEVRSAALVFLLSLTLTLAIFVGAGVVLAVLGLGGR